MSTIDHSKQRMLLGHPTGLYTLFFAEMWERFSYYGMRALLLFYMIKGFLGYNDSRAYAVYGAYTALVYMTPFFGGMLADKLLGARRAVVFGGLLMAAGHLIMGFENDIAFFTALALLIAGNGFFKPNISTIVGTLYPDGSPKRDGGFTIFYIGINLGAAMAPLLCGYIGETYGWHLGFGLATAGMLTGVAIFVAPTIITQGLILLGAVAAGGALIFFKPDHILSIAVNIAVALMLIVSGVIACIALSRGGLPEEAGAPPSRENLKKPLGPLPAEWMVYVCTLLLVPIIVLLVSDFSIILKGETVSVIPSSVIESLNDPGNSPAVRAFAVVAKEVSKPAGLVLALSGAIALVYLGIQSFRLEKVARERSFVVLILTFFSLFFWSFFEQAGSSINNFTDRNIDRVTEARRITESDVGQTIDIQPTQEQLGYYNGEEMFTLTDLDTVRTENQVATAEGDGNSGKNFTIPWNVVESNVGMGIAERKDEIPPSVLQSVNPLYILLFGMVFTVVWGFLGSRGIEPGPPIKFALGLLQLGLGFGAFWYGAQVSDDRGMVAIIWLVLGYMLHTTGELCLSPVGLSTVTKLAPAHLVSTFMGNWFLATAFSQYLAGIISQFTQVKPAGGGDGSVPPPIETVATYGGVFGNIAIAAISSAVVLFILSPILNRWMHREVVADDASS